MAHRLDRQDNIKKKSQRDISSIGASLRHVNILDADA